MWLPLSFSVLSQKFCYPASPEVQCGHMMKFWPAGYEQEYRIWGLSQALQRKEWASTPSCPVLASWMQVCGGEPTTLRPIKIMPYGWGSNRKEGTQSLDNFLEWDLYICYSLANPNGQMGRISLLYQHTLWLSLLPPLCFDPKLMGRGTHLKGFGT